MERVAVAPVLSLASRVEAVGCRRPTGSGQQGGGVLCDLRARLVGHGDVLLPTMLDQRVWGARPALGHHRQRKWQSLSPRSSERRRRAIKVLPGICMSFEHTPGLSELCRYKIKFSEEKSHRGHTGRDMASVCEWGTSGVATTRTAWEWACGDEVDGARPRPDAFSNRVSCIWSEPFRHICEECGWPTLSWDELPCPTRQHRFSESLWPECFK